MQERRVRSRDDLTDLTVKGVETDEELRLANDLMAKVHMPDYFVASHWLETCGAGYPGFRREHTRIVLWKGELAGSLRMNTETIRIGEARLKTGGFGWVTTTPRFRQKGICRRLVTDAIEYMKRHSYHVSMLFGIPNFYHRFDFATTLSDYAIVVDAAEALVPLGAGGKVREAKPGDIPAIQRIHAANDGDVACSLLRSSAHLTNKWERQIGGWTAGSRLGKGIRVLTSAQGKVIAYFFVRPDAGQLSVDEVGVSEAGVCEDVLAACARVAADEAVGRIRFLVPPPHPFARFLLQYKSSHEMQVVRDSGGMMAFVNVGESLESLVPEWESLLVKSALRDGRTEFTILLDGIHYRIRANRGALDVAQTPGKNKVSVTHAELMHLVTGYRYADDILSARRRLMTAEARAFFCALFPKRTPYVWVFDRF